MLRTTPLTGSGSRAKSPAPERAPPPAEHPLLSQCYPIPTPDLLRLEKTLRLWHRAGITGGLLLGTTRIGKTTAVDECVEHIEQIFSAKCFAARIDWTYTPKKSNQTTFLLRILNGVGYGTALGRGDPGLLLDRLIERLLTLTYDAGGRRCVLFFDEAQFLSPTEYQWLCYLFNRLRDREVALMVILVGQPEMRSTKLLLREGGDTQVIGRFMRSEFVFEGIRSESDLARLLNWIDDKSDYPVGSGESFLTEFVPRALKKGFRLEQLSGRLWSAYREWAPEHKADQHAGMKSAMSMMTFSSIVKTLVQELERRDAPDLVVESQLLSAIMKLVAVEHG